MIGACIPASVTSDQYIGGYAVREFGTAVLRQTGHFPLWNPYLFGGMPQFGAMNGDTFPSGSSLVLRTLLRPDSRCSGHVPIPHIFLCRLADVFLS